MPIALMADGQNLARTPANPQLTIVPGLSPRILNVHFYSFKPCYSYTSLDRVKLPIYILNLTGVLFSHQTSAMP
jgi:hypothetical protein